VSGTDAVSLVAGMVACGDVVKATLTTRPEDSPIARIRLVCRLSSASPREVEVATCDVAAAPGESVSFRLPVPAGGPITVRGSSLAVSWSVAAVDIHGMTTSEVPVVVAPRGGVALWLQRHAPPPG
jgi:hypothetical protein